MFRQGQLGHVVIDVEPLYVFTVCVDYRHLRASITNKHSLIVIGSEVWYTLMPCWSCDWCCHLAIE